ncbi:hypothetical protein [Maridesulfovibrio sp.]|uniref:hypothetical protein n=1 Tax=Maridesulfovibrio sp. TaxID=2795000 RepID=UPI003AFFCF4C
MKNISKFLSCFCFLSTCILAVSFNSFAADQDTKSYFSSPAEADAAAARAYLRAVSESKKAGIELAVIEEEIKSAKKEVRNAASSLAAARRGGSEDGVNEATSRLRSVRDELNEIEIRASKAVVSVTAVKKSTISSMRSQRMGWSEIARELGATKDSLSPRSLGNMNSRQERTGVMSYSRGSVHGNRSGTIRDLKGGVSRVSGVIGAIGDKAIGLSRISSKARSSVKAGSTVAIEGRGNLITVHVGSSNFEVKGTPTSIQGNGVFSVTNGGISQSKTGDVSIR